MNTQNLIRSLKYILLSIKQGDQALNDKVKRLDQIIRFTVSHLSDQENLYFSSYYAKYSFLSSKYKISGREQYLFHTFRKLSDSNPDKVESKHVDLGIHVINLITKRCLNTTVYEGITHTQIESDFVFHSRKEQEIFIPYHLSFLLNYDIVHEKFSIGDDDGSNVWLDFEDDQDSKELKSHIAQLEKWNRLPIKIALFDSRVTDGTYTASYYVLEPDFLIDVTSISEAFDAFGVSVAGYGLRKLIDKGASLSLHVGNLANVILDELIYDPFISFNHFKNRIFQINPMAFASFTNDQVRQLLETIELHYNNIKNAVNVDLDQQGINGKNVYVEPSFYAPRIGVQGRFDLLHQQGDIMNIIELKSGKTFRPNSYGLNNSHYHQTLLYDLILESNYGKNIKRNNFILYSAESDRPLRYAPNIKSEQREALKVRNRIYIDECQMQNSSSEDNYIRKYLEKYSGKLSGFKGQDITEVSKIYSGLTEKEKAYWESSFSFLSREYSLSKIGDELSEFSKGLSSIWQLDDDQKKERFLIINNLKITLDNSQEEDPHLLLEYSEDSAELSNFRVGDIIILYPSDALHSRQMKSQIFKCTLSKIDNDHIVIRLRSRQMNAKAFDQNKLWNIERDILDSSFSKTFRQLFHFAKADKIKRALILGAQQPSEYESLPISKMEGVTNIQQKIIMKAIASEDYHLIWGPPGTGKTSVILKEIITHYHRNTQTRMLIIAYTNRAVDEICQAIESIDEDINYIRIGSKYSCGEAYKKRLLNKHLESISDRKSLKQLLKSQQIYIGTLASIIGKPELFDLLDFGICLVDEASQILESSLAGILTKAKKFVLIGDHLQLPAIVLQKPFQAEIEESELKEVGFRSYAESLFERLYRQCTHHKWTWAYSQLSEQGRMHQSIMGVVNDLFYSDELQLLPQNDRIRSNDLTMIINDSRLLYHSTPVNDSATSKKVNLYEAKAVCRIIEKILTNFQNQKMDFHPESIGVITPFRAQIALIKSELKEKKIDSSNITIDTVERYQGGARDIIIMSAVVNSPFQLEALVSTNSEGIDRKLNVAISRAREQFILVGNQEILEYEEQYMRLIQKCQIINI